MGEEMAQLGKTAVRNFCSCTKSVLYGSDEDQDISPSEEVLGKMISGYDPHLASRNVRSEGWSLSPSIGPTFTHASWTDIMFWAVLSGNHDLAELALQLVRRRERHVGLLLERRAQLLGAHCEDALLPVRHVLLRRLGASSTVLLALCYYRAP